MTVFHSRDLWEVAGRGVLPLLTYDEDGDLDEVTICSSMAAAEFRGMPRAIRLSRRNRDGFDVEQRYEQAAGQAAGHATSNCIDLGFHFLSQEMLIWQDYEKVQPAVGGKYLWCEKGWDSYEGGGNPALFTAVAFLWYSPQGGGEWKDASGILQGDPAFWADWMPETPDVPMPRSLADACEAFEQDQDALGDEDTEVSFEVLAERIEGLQVTVSAMAASLRDLGRRAPGG